MSRKGLLVVVFVVLGAAAAQIAGAHNGPPSIANPGFEADGQPVSTPAGWHDLGVASASKTEAAQEFKFSIPDPWSRQLFIALCRRYGLRPFRYRRMHQQTVIVSAPASFVRGVLWPEFEELSDALTRHLLDITDKIIREEVHASTGDAEEVDEPRRLG